MSLLVKVHKTKQFHYVLNVVHLIPAFNYVNKPGRDLKSLSFLHRDHPLPAIAGETE